VHHVAISVKSIEQSTEFYTQVFGFSEVQRFEREDLNGKAAFLRLGDMHLEIWEFSDGVAPKDDLSNLKIRGLRHIAFSVANLDQAYAELKSKMKMSELRVGASGGRYFFISDPDGIMIELYEER